MMNQIPSVALTDLREPGLGLISTGTTEFNDLAAASIPSGSDSLTPLLSAFLSNETSQTIVGYTVSWTSIDSGGNTTTDYRTVFDAFTLSGLILPGGNRRVTILTNDPPPLT
jgi:hypothetical protein